MKSDIFKIDLKTLKKIITEVANELELDFINKNKDSIVYSYGGDILSFGNKVEISFENKNKKKIEVNIESKSKFAFQIFDWGSNKDLEEKIIQHIKQKI